MSSTSETTTLFAVKVHSSLSAYFDDLTGIYVTGENSALGKWIPSAAVRLEKKKSLTDTSTIWGGSIRLGDSGSGDICYRYFIGRRMNATSPALVYVLKWETALMPRCLKVKSEVANQDEFGKISDCVSISDGWLSDPRLREVRFSFLLENSIEVLKPNKLLTSGSYKITLTPLVANEEEKGKKECALDPYAMISVSVLNDEKRRAFRKQICADLSTATSGIGGRDMVTFKIHSANTVGRMRFRFSVADAKKKTGFAIADVKALFQDKTHGTMIVDLIDTSTKAIIGKMTLMYLIALPSTNSIQQLCTMEKTYSRYWKRRPTLDIGHRGMGNSNTKIAKERENTLKSLLTACEKGADFVELDVQLTRDEIPVLYHDFQICTEGKGGMLCEVAFKDLSLAELRKANLHHAYDLKKPDDRDRYMPVVDRKEEIKHPTSRAFPTFEEILTKLPPYLGFNVEVKYPMFFANNHHECEEFFDVNMFLDRILEVLAKHAKQRRIIFSSFSPEACTLIKLKQNRYPTLFLTQGRTVRYEPYLNPLTASSEIAISFALSEGFLGVSFPSEELLRTPAIIKKARDHDLVSFVWGDDFDKPENIELMKKAGLDAVIYDRIDEHTNGKRNIFAK